MALLWGRARLGALTLAYPHTPPFLSWGRFEECALALVLLTRLLPLLPHKWRALPRGPSRARVDCARGSSPRFFWVLELCSGGFLVSRAVALARRWPFPVPMVFSVYVVG